MNLGNNISAFSFYDEEPEEGLISATIYINGNELDAKYMLTSIWVRKEVNKIGKAEVHFKAWSSLPKDDEPDSDDEVFNPGNSIRIEVGYLNSTPEESVFEGVIVAQQLDLELDGDMSFKVECRDYLYTSTIVPRTAIYSDITNSDLISTLIAKYSPIKATIGSTSTTYENLTQYEISDWDFILERARLSGFFIVTEGKETKIDKPNTSSESVHTLTLDKNIIDMKGKLQASKQLSKVEVFAWNSKEQKLVTASATTDTVSGNDQGEISANDLAEKLGSNELVLQTSEYIDDDSLQKWAEAKLLESTLQRVKGTIVCKGTANVKAGCIVKIENVNTHLNGEAFCGAVEHEVKDGMWKTTVCMGFDEGDKNKSDTPKKTSNSIRGLQIGKVAKIEEDPRNEYNIQVEIPLFTSTEINKVWARLSTFWASDKYGSFFIPDVGDEVVLGFFDNDPGKPVILGSLYSSKLKPVAEITKDNFIKSIVTKSQLKLQFDEDKKVITLETPGKNKIIIDDDKKGISLLDQNSNKIVMSDSGISIESAKSITIKAQTDINIQAGTELNLKGTSAVNIKGTNIEAKADVAFTGKGSASAELSAGGQTVVKGAMVMIN